MFYLSRTMLGSYSQYSPSGYGSSHDSYGPPHDNSDVKPFTPGRIAPNSSAYHVHHPSQMYSSMGMHPDSLVYVLPSDSKEASANSEQTPKTAGSRWREEETMALVEIWRDKICQTRWWKQNKCVRVNKEMWDEIAAVLMERGIYRTPSQCQIRMKNLLQYFRQIIDHRRSEKQREELPEYFEIVNNIMNGRQDGDMKKRKYFDDDDLESKMGLLGQVSHKMENGNASHVTSPDEKNAGDENQEKECSGQSSAPNSEVNGRRPSSSSPPMTNGGSPPPDDSSNPPSSSSQGFTHPPYPGIGLSGHPNAQVFEGGIRYPAPQRFTIPTRLCMPPPSHQPQPPIGGAFQDLSLSTLGRCSGHGLCCGEPPLKRHCLENACSFKPPNVKSNFSSEYARACRSATAGCSQPPSGFQSHVPHYPPSSTAFESTNASQQAALTNGGAHNHRSIAPVQQEDWAQTLKDFMLHQQKQMDALLEIEKKRLEIEEKRWKMKEESDSRNGAFLMEAVRILAEAYKKNGIKENPV